MYDVRQGLHGLAGGLGIVQQHHAEVVPLGIAADIAQDLRRIGVAGGGILRADIPVDPVVALLLGLRLEGFHNAAPAVAVADRVCAAAGKAQPVNAADINIGLQRLPQRLDVLPEGIGACVNF